MDTRPIVLLIFGLLIISFFTALLGQFFRVGDSQTFSGIIYEQPVLDGRYKSINLNGKKVFVTRFFKLNQGDFLTVDFSTCAYNQKYNSYDKCEISIDPSRENKFLKKIFEIRGAMISKAKLNLPSPHDYLLLAMTIGYEDDLPEGLTKKLRDIGAIHMLVVSGYNVSLVLNSSGVLLLRFPRTIYISLSVFLLSFFILLTGFDPPIVRSVIMGIFVVFSKAYSRPATALYLLVLSGIIMVSWDFSYLSNVSFQLSFAATFGVVISGYIFKSSKSFYTDLGVSIGASIFVLPIISFYFGTVNLLGIISSIFLGWMVPLITYLGFVIYALNLHVVHHVAMLENFSVPVKFIFVVIVDLFFKICDAIAHFSFLNIGYKFSSRDLVLYYAFTGIIIFTVYSIKRNLTKNE